MTPRERLVYHVQELERLQRLKEEASADLKAGFRAAKSQGYDPTTLRVVLKLRTMTPAQRQERRALEAIYLAALGMLEGDPLPDEARRRLDAPPAPPDAPAKKAGPRKVAAALAPPPPKPEQPTLQLKDPAEARTEGEAAAAAGKRIYDNPYPAGDPCRAAWDEGWCAQSKSHGLATPAAYQRRSTKPPDEPKAGAAGVDDKKGAA